MGDWRALLILRLGSLSDARRFLQLNPRVELNQKLARELIIFVLVK